MLDLVWNDAQVGVSYRYGKGHCIDRNDSFVDISMELFLDQIVDDDRLDLRSVFLDFCEQLEGDAGWDFIDGANAHIIRICLL